MDGVELVAVAAVAENGIVGDGTSVPWDLPEDRRQYRERVADHPVVLGRRTFEWMHAADDLPGSVQVVLSRSERSYPEASVRVVDGPDAATDAVAETGTDCAYVLGGEAVYELFQPRLDRMVLSRVHAEPEGDAYYPAFDRSEWRLVEENPYDGFTLEFWERTSDDALGEEGGRGHEHETDDHDDGGDQ